MNDKKSSAPIAAVIVVGLLLLVPCVLGTMLAVSLFFFSQKANPVVAPYTAPIETGPEYDAPPDPEPQP